MPSGHVPDPQRRLIDPEEAVGGRFLPTNLAEDPSISSAPEGAAPQFCASGWSIQPGLALARLSNKAEEAQAWESCLRLSHVVGEDERIARRADVAAEGSGGIVG